MSKSDEAYAGPERRQKGTAVLRAEMDELAEDVGDSSELTGDDMIQLYAHIRDLYRSGLGGRSSGMLRLVRDVHANDLSPALLELMDSVLGRKD